METNKEKRTNFKQENINLSFRETKKISVLTQDQRGITLVALILTIIIIVIVSAIGISVVYKSRIIEVAINGSIDYATEGINENRVLEGTESKIEYALDNLKKILGGENLSPEESIPPAMEKYKVTFYTYNNQNKTEEVTKEIILPNIENVTEDGKTYIARGWATSNEPNAEIIEPGTKVEITEDITYYASYETKETATFYYNSNRASGSFRSAKIEVEATTEINYIGEKIEGTLSVPAVVTNSVGKYNSTYVGVSNATKSMTTTNIFSNGSTYYAVYSADVKIYYPNSKTTATNYTRFRNEYFTSTSAMSTVLATTKEETTNFSFSSDISGYSLQGFGTNANTTTRNYTSVASLATSNDREVYAILYKVAGSNTYYTYCIGKTTATSTESLTIEALRDTAMIGKYVDYKPAGSDYIIERQYSGTGSNQTFTKNDNMKWRIWGVEESKLLLISETLAGKIGLRGAEGYNNAVKILNDACSTAFGNVSTYGSGTIKARSINQDDIDKVTNMTTDTQRKSVKEEYGTTVTTKWTNYPNIYGEEIGKTEGGSLDRSSQSSWVTGITKEEFKGKYTGYNYYISKYATQTMYYTLLTNMNANSSTGIANHEEYFTASRYIASTGSDVAFEIFMVVASNVSYRPLYYGFGNGEYHNYATRPMIEVNLDSIRIGVTGSGTDTDPYSMAKK